MTTPLFTEIEAEVAALPEKVPSRPDMWIVLACNEDNWTIPSVLRSCGGLWTNQESAELAASSLPSVWHHKRIVRIPGEGAS